MIPPSKSSCSAPAAPSAPTHPGTPQDTTPWRLPGVPFISSVGKTQNALTWVSGIVTVLASRLLLLGSTVVWGVQHSQNCPRATGGDRHMAPRGHHPPAQIPPVLVPCPPLSPATPTSGSAPPIPPPIIGPHVSPGPTEIARTGGWAVGASKNNNSDCAKKKKKSCFLGIFSHYFNKKRSQSPRKRSHRCPAPQGQRVAAPPPSPALSPRGGPKSPPCCHHGDSDITRGPSRSNLPVTSETLRFPWQPSGLRGGDTAHGGGVPG